MNRAEFLKFLGVILAGIGGAFLEVMTAFVIMLFAQTLIKPLFFMSWLSKFHITINESHSLFLIALIFMTTYIVKNIFSFFEAKVQSRFVENFTQIMRLKLFKIYSKMDYEHYISHNTSDFSTTLSLNIYDAFQRGLVSISKALSESFIVIMLLLFALILRPKLFMGLMGIGGLFAFLVKRYLFPRVYEGGQRVQKARAQLFQDIMQFVQSFKDVRIFGKEALWQQHIMKSSHAESQEEDKQRIFSILPRLVLESIFALLLGSSMLFVQDISVLGVYVYIGFRLLPACNRIITEMNHVKHLTARLERFYRELTSTPQEHFIDLQNFTFQKQLTFENVSFGYKDKNFILKNVSFSVKQGECIGFIGKSGSGKSTLIDLLLGLLKPTHGRILIDDLEATTARQWRQKIGYVSQSISLIDASLAQNVALGDIDPKKVEKVLEQAQLPLSQFPEGLNTPIGERGIRLSGGERQRVAIARALYHDPSVLIFDEATSALDPLTESQLMETLYTISQNYTVLMVAHRHETLTRCHRLYRVENGQVSKV